MKTKTFNKSFEDVYKLAEEDIKPLGAKLGKLMEEVGELAECVNIHQGYITHKEMKEPLAGEVADVVQCALAVLVDAHPELSRKEQLELFLYHFERKNGKWSDVQSGDADRAAANLVSTRDETATPPTYSFNFESATPASPPTDIERRVISIIGEQLGYAPSSIRELDGSFVEVYGADSLDLVELVMAIEDEFEAEISDADAAELHTPRQLIAYVRQRYGLDQIAEAFAEAFTEPAEEDASFEESAQAVEDEARRQPSKGMFSPQSQQDVRQHFDPAADYTERTGRHLSLEERMQERSIHNNKEL